MAYIVTPPPVSDNPNDLKLWAHDELSRVGADSTLLNEMFERNMNVRAGYGWRDLKASVSSAKLPSSSAPTWDTLVTSPFQALKFTVNDYVLLSPFHVDHDMKPGGKGYIHVHWTTDGTNTAVVKWELKIIRAKGHNQEAFGTVTTINVSEAANATAWQHMITECSDGDALTLPEPDELLMVALKRVTNGGTDNTAKIFGLNVDFHYQTDRYSTPGKAPDFYA